MAALSLSGMLSFGETSNLMVCRQDQVSHVQIYAITAVIFTAETGRKTTFGMFKNDFCETNLWMNYLFSRHLRKPIVLKVVNNENVGVGKMANDRYWPRNAVVDVRLSLYLAAILYKIYFLFRLLQPNY
jgi:hypothetical protein